MSICDLIHCTTCFCYLLTRVGWKDGDLKECQHLMVHPYHIGVLVLLVRGMLLERSVQLVSLLNLQFFYDTGQQGLMFELAFFFSLEKNSIVRIVYWVICSMQHFPTIESYTATLLWASLYHKTNVLTIDLCSYLILHVSSLFLLIISVPFFPFSIYFEKDNFLTSMCIICVILYKWEHFKCIMASGKKIVQKMFLDKNCCVFYRFSFYENKTRW